MYFISTPWWVKKLYPSCIWDTGDQEKTLYLTFDDGPHPVATPFVLDQLKNYSAKGTFFCIGKNVAEYPDLYKRILNEGHITGNHTYNHLNGWNTPDREYINDIYEAKKVIASNLFRPPYGRIKKFQLKLIRESQLNLKTIMWNVLSGDFDVKYTPGKCVSNVINNARKGSIIVFHDSSKAFTRLEYTLPRVLEHFTKKGYTFKSIKNDS